MPGPLEIHLVEEHDRIEALLARAVADPERFDGEAFAQARSLLLRHIGIEEKILLVDARLRLGGVPLEIAHTLRIEHGAIASLLVPTPDHALVGELRGLLATHDAREEGPGGVYEICEKLAGDEVHALLDRVRAARQVPVARYFDGPGVYRTAAEALRASSRQRAPRTTPR